MPGPTDLYDAASELLTAAVESLALIETPLVGAPERRLVRYGTPTDDCCEQLTVYVNPITEMATSPAGNEAGRRASRGSWSTVVTFTITMGRCVPVVTEKGGKVILPPLAAQDAASQQIDADGWALWNGIHVKQARGELFSLCTNVQFGIMQARTPSGGCAGWMWDITVRLPGFSPEPGS